MNERDAAGKFISGGAAALRAVGGLLAFVLGAIYLAATSASHTEIRLFFAVCILGPALLSMIAAWWGSTEPDDQWGAGIGGLCGIVTPFVFFMNVSKNPLGGFLASIAFIFVCVPCSVGVGIFMDKLVATSEGLQARILALVVVTSLLVMTAWPLVIELMPVHHVAPVQAASGDHGRPEVFGGELPPRASPTTVALRWWEPLQSEELRLAHHRGCWRAARLLRGTHGRTTLTFHDEVEETLDGHRLTVQSWPRVDEAVEARRNHGSFNAGSLTGVVYCRAGCISGMQVQWVDGTGVAEIGMDDIRRRSRRGNRERRRGNRTR